MWPAVWFQGAVLYIIDGPDAFYAPGAGIWRA
jgi:hypothetical protein